MAMRRRIHIWPRLVNSRVYHKRRGIQQTAWPTVNDLPFFVDEDEVRGFD